ncbi:MAG: DUF6152 family protein [Gammaproteobacteria bacterium]
MTRRFSKTLAGVLVLSGIGYADLPASAHHAFSAEFDINQPIEITGVISRFVLTNPHSWLYIDVADENGNVTNWGFEFGTPFALRSRGVTKETLAPGTKVTIKGYRSRNGQPFGYATLTVLEDGRRFATGGAPDAPSSEPSASATSTAAATRSTPEQAPEPERGTR